MNMLIVDQDRFANYRATKALRRNVNLINSCTLWMAENGVASEHLRTIVSLRREGHQFKDIITYLYAPSHL